MKQLHLYLGFDDNFATGKFTCSTCICSRKDRTSIEHIKKFKNPENHIDFNKLNEVILEDKNKISEIYPGIKKTPIFNIQTHYQILYAYKIHLSLRSADHFLRLLVYELNVLNYNNEKVTQFFQENNLSSYIKLTKNNSFKIKLKTKDQSIEVLNNLTSIFEKINIQDERKNDIKNFFRKFNSCYTIINTNFLSVDEVDRYEELLFQAAELYFKIWGIIEENKGGIKFDEEEEEYVDFEEIIHLEAEDNIRYFRGEETNKRKITLKKFDDYYVLKDTRKDQEKDEIELEKNNFKKIRKIQVRKRALPPYLHSFFTHSPNSLRFFKVILLFI
jgi:hypothetical protein